MTLLAVMLVLGSGLFHAVWNLFTKKSLNKIVFLWSIHLTAFVLLLPNFIHELATTPLRTGDRGFMLLSLVMQVAYYALMAQAYKYGDMSQVYPMMRGIGALLVPLASVLLFSETLNAVGWLGVAGIVIGLLAIGGAARFAGRPPAPNKALLPSVLVGCCIACYVVADRAVLDVLSPWALLEIGNISCVLFFTAGALRSKQIRREWRVNWRRLLLGSLMAPGSYLLFLYAMKLAPLAYIAPLREFGTVFGTLLAILLLKERQGAVRIAMSILITIGIITVGVGG